MKQGSEGIVLDGRTKTKIKKPLKIKGFLFVESTDIFSNSFVRDLEVLSGLRKNLDKD
jgi:hypothetical protein